MSKKKNKREEFLSMIPSGIKTILDVGCGDGGLSARFKERGAKTVGVEKAEKLCLLAKEKLDVAILGDVETLKLDYPEGYFDCVIYADILEHLTDPLNVLKKHRFHLKKNGYLVASIPNVRYYKVILRLILSGTWDYSDTGILDRTHLRFFGLVNIIELFKNAGYEIVEIRRNIVASRGFKILNLIFFGKMKNFLTYQYYIKAKNSVSGEAINTGRKTYRF